MSDWHSCRPLETHLEEREFKPKNDNGSTSRDGMACLADQTA
jgi:hypothetical protein